VQFADDPTAWFGNDGAAADRLDPAEREKLQQAALNHRLESLISKLKPLAALAKAQGVDASVALDDAPKLFYPHSIYKSYDPAWLEARDFGRMTTWVGNFTARELAPPQGVDLPTIDAWLDWLEAEYRLDIAHSTGTTGRMSLVFRAAEDAPLRLSRIAMTRADWHRSRGLPTDETSLRVIWPGPASGRSTIQKIVAHWQEAVVSAEQNIVTLFDSDLGADYELYVVGARNAQARGELELPAASPYVERSLSEAEHRHANREIILGRMIQKVSDTMRGRRVMLLGGPLTAYPVASAGVATGLRGVFDPTSFSCLLGGLKGFAAPPNFDDTLNMFMGSNLRMPGYGMTELNAGFIGCEAGRYHVPPWVVPWALDPTDSWKPKPRQGTQEGRAAFLDLATRNNWGGIVAADHIQISYDPCPCGRSSPSIAGDIKRVQDPDHDYYFVPAAREAVDAMLEVMRG
jgi:hypothetical protein